MQLVASVCKDIHVHDFQSPTHLSCYYHKALWASGQLVEYMGKRTCEESSVYVAKPQMRTSLTNDLQTVIKNDKGKQTKLSSWWEWW